MSKYEEFDSQIFNITKIMLDTLTDGQRKELLKVMGEIEVAHREGHLTDDQYSKLMCTMMDCGMEPPPVMDHFGFKGIEHYDIFEGDAIVFWLDISDPPQAIQTAAKEIDGPDFSLGCFGMCVDYSFEEKGFCVVTDTGTSPEERGNIFYIDQEGDKHWFEADISPEVLEQIIGECSKIVKETELGERLAAYTRSEDLQRDIADLAQDYRNQGLPVPPKERLREDAVAEARKCLETVMACEAKGHLWKERADPENGISELSCRRCGAEEHLRW